MWFYGAPKLFRLSSKRGCPAQDMKLNKIRVLHILRQNRKHVCTKKYARDLVVPSRESSTDYQAYKETGSEANLGRKVGRPLARECWSR